MAAVVKKIFLFSVNDSASHLDLFMQDLGRSSGSEYSVSPSLLLLS